MLTLLEACQDLGARIGVGVPSSIIAGEGDLPPQYLMMLYESARDLTRRADWQVLERVATFTSTAVELQAVMTAAWPDFRRMKKGTFVNITQACSIRPIEARAHTVLTVQGVSPSVRPCYRIRGNQLLFPGNTTAGNSCQFEYISHYWCVAADGTTYKSRPTLDSDVLLLDDEALILGAKWRFKKENGLAYGEDFNDCEKLIQELIGNNREYGVLSLTSGGRGRGNGSISEISIDSYGADTTLLTADTILFDGSLA